MLSRIIRLTVGGFLAAGVIAAGTVASQPASAHDESSVRSEQLKQQVTYSTRSKNSDKYDASQNERSVQKPHDPYAFYRAYRKEREDELP